MSKPDVERILVIKHGALGDFILATGPFQAIREAHPDHHITLMTTAAYADFAKAGDWFDDIWIDHKPKLWQPGAWLEMRARLNGTGYTRIYDLQTSARTSWYFKLLKEPRPEWSGIAQGCSLPHANEFRDEMHTIERQAEQLHMAGIENVPPPSVDFLTADVSRFQLEARYGLLIPGGAAHRPGKRYPAIAYRELCRHMTKQGVMPVIIGGNAEADVCAEVIRDVPEAQNLCGQTSLAEVAELARGAQVAIGNDTGPMHLIAPTGCKTVVLFSTDSDPKLCGQRGPDVTVLSALMTSGIPFLDVVQAADLGGWINEPMGTQPIHMDPLD
jgi:ADP-heptose:LPS heptosyltransferase